MDPSLSSIIQEDHLSCPICFNLFTRPKALNCLHTFCQQCLQDYVAKLSQEKKAFVKSFPCPTCREETTIPPTGVTGLRDNHQIIRLLDTVGASQSSPQVPPRPAVSDIEAAEHSISPASHTIPSIPPRPKSVSPTPIRAYNASPIPASVSHDMLPRSQSPRSSIGQILTDGIVALEGAVGGISNKIHDFSSQLYPQKPVEKKDTPMLPFEFVEHEEVNSGCCDSQATGLYPELPQQVGPGMKGVMLSFGRYNPSVDGFLKPHGMTIGLNGEFVISDLQGNRVLVFKNDGKFKTRFNTDCVIKDIAITKENQILMAVTNSGQSIMRLYTMEGKCLHKYGDFYRFDNPSGIAVSVSNHAVVTNLAANNVLVFTEQRKFSTKFGSKGAGEKHFNCPSFVTTTSKDYIVVSDTGNNCVKIFDIEGKFKRMFGSLGQNHGQLNEPLGITTDEKDNIIIADSQNFRVEIFTVKGDFYSTLVSATDQIGPGVRPVNVAVTPRNNIAVLLLGTGFAEVRVYHWQPTTACKIGFSNV